jgi:hypothetical protein
MDLFTAFGIVLIVYGVICLYVGFYKPTWLWEAGKIQSFIKLLGEKGTVILLGVVGGLSLVGGILLYFLL